MLNLFGEFFGLSNFVLDGVNFVLKLFLFSFFFSQAFFGFGEFAGEFVVGEVEFVDDLVALVDGEVNLILELFNMIDEHGFAVLRANYISQVRAI